MVYKVTFSGIDGCGKSTTIDVISTQLSYLGKTIIHPYRPAFAQLPGGNREYFGKTINGLVDDAHQWADTRDSKLLVGLVNVLYGRVWTLLEQYALHKYNPDVVLMGRDPLLDPFVYSHFYFPHIRVSSDERIRTIRRVNGAGLADLLIYLDVSPDQAYQRILARIEKEKSFGAKDRAKWGHMHENPNDLNFLRDTFEEGISLLQEKLGVKIIRVDASRPHHEVIAEVLNIVR